MASLRGATKIWASATVGANDVSAPAYVPSVNVAVYVSNEGTNAHTFKLQVAESGSDAGGLNEFDATNAPDGGLVWYDYVGGETLTVANAEKKAWDFSPFAPQLVRLVCTSGSDNLITAIVSSYGPN